MNKEIQERIECIKNNQLPKGYRRIKDIGIAPEDWTLGKMSDVIENVSRPVSKPNEPYWRLGIKSWAKGTFHAFVDNPETVNMDELYEVKENDLIVNITFAWEHAIAIAKKEDDGLLVSHRFPTYVFKEGQVPEYYQAVITQRYFKDMLDHISPGGAGRNRVLNRKDFLNLPCFIPPKEEQEKIAEILLSFDKIIKLKKYLISEKHHQKVWLMQNLLTCNSGFRLPKFNEVWESHIIGDLGKTYSGLTGKTNKDFGQGEPYIPYTNIFTNCIVNNDDFEYVKVLEGEKQNTVEYGDLFFTTSSETPQEVGMSSVYLGENIKLYLNSFCFGFRFDNFHIILPEFAAYYFRGNFVKRILYKLAQGSTRYNLPISDFLGERICVPPSTDEQQAIFNLLSSCDKEIDLLKKELQEWENKKQTYTKLLISGIVRV